MNKTVLTIAFAVALSAPAVAQTIGAPGYGYAGYAYFGDEPNTEAGSLPYANHPSDNAVTDYAGDDNGIQDALAGTPTLILQSRYYFRDLPVGSSDTHVDYVKIFEDLGLAGYFVPGLTGHFLAWHGTWVDSNGDGFLTSPAFDDVLYVDAGNGRDCSNGGLTIDPDTPDVTSTCGNADDEWVPAAATSIVGYITPYVPIETFPTNTYGEEQGRNPDMEFVGPAGAEGGRYYSPATNWDFVFVDNSLLETTAVEVIANPDVNTDGPRSRTIGSSSLVDTDVFPSVSADAEQLYQENILGPLVGMGFDPDHPENLVETGDPTDPTDQFVGPATAPYSPSRENENPSAHASGYAVYFDIYIEPAGWTPGVYTSGDGTNGGGISYTGDGQETAPILAGVYGFLGAWNDKNGDGYIGEPEPSPGCDDAHDCGVNQDANEYGDEIEFTRACRPDRKNGEILGTLESSDGVWGGNGVYVLTDRVRVENGDDWDQYAEDGRVAFNPYDDIVVDASDGSIDAFVTEGPVQFRLVCNDPAGAYASYEHFLFPASNLGFDVTASTDSFSIAFVSVGITIPQTVSDSDTLAAWTL